MTNLQKTKTSLTSVGIWLSTDPRRISVIVAAVTTLATTIALLVGMSPSEVLVGPYGGGGSGGT